MTLSSLLQALIPGKPAPKLITQEVRQNPNAFQIVVNKWVADGRSNEARLHCC